MSLRFLRRNDAFADSCGVVTARGGAGCVACRSGLLLIAGEPIACEVPYSCCSAIFSR